MADEKTILIIEDDESLRDAYEMIFEEHGYKCIMAPDGIEGLRAFTMNRAVIDLVITDLQMPMRDGSDVASSIVKLTCNSCPIIMVSGYINEETKEKLSDVESIHFVDKPFDEDTFVDLIKNVLAA